MSHDSLNDKGEASSAPRRSLEEASTTNSNSTNEEYTFTGKLIIVADMKGNGTVQVGPRIYHLLLDFDDVLNCWFLRC